MDYTPVDNNYAYQVGADQQRFGGQAQVGWLPMNSAPRDGTPIEIRCTYGVAPWYGLFQWTNKFTCEQDGKIYEYTGAPRWAKIGDDASGFTEDDSFRWRPYHGGPASYVDPTDGAQNTPEYWRGAVASKYGLPLDAFKPKDEKEPVGFAEKIFNLFR